MKQVLLLIIHCYWRLIPEEKRRCCVFKKSCSNYVFEITKQDGFLAGAKALLFRYNNCRGEFTFFKNPLTLRTQVVLKSGVIVEDYELSENILLKYKTLVEV
jgi:putative component of membrane protein insertase Oxa1/YidC/SpoIIIJ protein YidD